MSLKKYAEQLLEVADAIDKQAEEVTRFVCDKCNHTTTLAKINAARKKVASDMGENVTISDIMVDDQVSCPAPSCEGVLSYKETDESKDYYYNPVAKDPDATHSEKTETPEEETAESEKTQKKEREEGKHTASEPIDYDAIDRYVKG